MSKCTRSLLVTVFVACMICLPGCRGIFGKRCCRRKPHAIEEGCVLNCSDGELFTEDGTIVLRGDAGPLLASDLTLAPLPAPSHVESPADSPSAAMPPIVPAHPKDSHPVPPPRQTPTVPSAPAQQAPSQKPASLTLKVQSSQAVVNVGDEFNFAIEIENQGEAAIESVDMKATLGDNLSIVSITPTDAGKASGNEVTFNRFEKLLPMPLTFQIRVRVTAAGEGIGRIAVEIRSPILTAGPLTQEAVVRVTEP